MDFLSFEYQRSKLKLFVCVISLVVAFGVFIPLTLRIANNNHQTKATTEKAKIMQVLHVLEDRGGYHAD